MYAATFFGAAFAPGSIAFAAASFFAVCSAVVPGTKSAFFSAGFLLTVFALSQARNVPFSSTPAFGFLAAGFAAALAGAFAGAAFLAGAAFAEALASGFAAVFFTVDLSEVFEADFAFVLSETLAADTFEIFPPIT